MDPTDATDGGPETGLPPIQTEIARAAEAALGLGAEGEAGPGEAARADGQSRLELATQAMSGAREDTLTARALARLRAAETRRQEGVEAVLEAAARRAEAEGGARPRAIDPDWMAALIGLAGEVTEPWARDLWARLLVHQASAGHLATSRATLDAARLLEPETARLFESAMRVWAAMGQCLHLDRSPVGPVDLGTLGARALEEIGLFRRETERAAQLSVTGGLRLVFFADEALDRPATVTLDRLIPTWRGQELGRVLVPGLYPGLRAEDLREVVPELSDLSARAGVLTDWATQVARRGIRVVVAHATGDEVRPTRRLVLVEEREWLWRPLDRREIGAVRSAQDEARSAHPAKMRSRTTTT